MSVRCGLTAVACGALAWLLVGGLPGAAVGGCIGLAVARHVSNRPSAEQRREEARLHADLPVAADLFAGCLAAGSSPTLAAVTVADALPGPVADRLRPVVGALRLGGDPAECWQILTASPVTAPLGRALARASVSGAAPADVLARSARQLRTAERAAALAEVRRAGVRATLPLAGCFLPAFVLIGVVPTVAGLVSDVLRRS